MAANTFKPWLKYDRRTKLFKATKMIDASNNEAFKLLEPLLQKHEVAFREKSDQVGSSSGSYLHLYYTLRHTMSYEQTLTGFFFFLAAAFDTTATSISTVLLLLAMNPGEQEKLFDEIDSVLSDDSHGVDKEKISQLTYLDLVIKEALRLLPTVRLIARKATENVELSKSLF
jgi:cytochrome P450